jgi:hypothetical protein
MRRFLLFSWLGFPFFLSAYHDLTEAAELQSFGKPNGDTLMEPRDDAFDEVQLIGSIRLPFFNRLYDRFFVSYSLLQNLKIMFHTFIFTYMYKYIWIYIFICELELALFV